MEVNLTKLKEQTWVMLIMVFASNICSSLLVFYLFKHDVFVSTDSFKLILLGLSITTPIWILNCFLCGIATTTNNPDKDPQLEYIGLVGSLFTIVVLYPSIVIRFLFFINFSTAFWISLSLQIIILVSCIIYHNKEKK